MLTTHRLACFLAVALAAAGCAPQTAFRRSALVPAPTGDTYITPVEGHTQLAGQVTHGTVGYDELPEIEQPSLHVARTQLRGHARFRVGEYVTIGGEASYSHVELSEPNAVGVPPVTRDHVWGIGPVVSVHFGPSKSNVSFGLSAALTLESVPYAIWERTTPHDPFTDGWGFDPEQHRLAEEGSDMMLLTRISGGMTYRFLEELSLHTGLSFQNHAVNIGYDDQERDGSTLSATDIGVVPFVGVKARLPDDGLYAMGQWYAPLGFEQLEGAQWGALVQLGADLQ